MNTMRAPDEKARRTSKLAARMVPEGLSSLDDVWRAVEDLRTLHREMEQRKGFKPLCDREIRQAINAGRP
jgi:hypothetical protein